MQRILEIDRGRQPRHGGRRHQTAPARSTPRRAGLALENQGDIDRQSVAGAISTATHGTGAAFRNLAAQVVALRLVTATGEVLELSQESDPEAYLAARVSVGALGVISALTIACVPLYTLRRHDLPQPLEETLARLAEHVDTNDHFEFFVFPYCDAALTRRNRRSHEEPASTTALEALAYRNS